MSQKSNNNIWLCCAVFLQIAAMTITSAEAKVLKWGSSSWNQARLVPVGEQKLSVKVQSYNSTQSFSSNGDLTASGKPYLDTTTFQRLIQRSGTDGLKIRSILKQQGISESTPIFTTEFALETKEVQTELSWTRGLTDWWMVGLNVPYIQSETKVKTVQRLSPEYQKLKEQLGKNGVDGKGIESFVNDQANTFVDFKLDENQYNGVGGSIEYRGLGDIELLSQVNLLESEKFYGSLRQRVAVPTGKNEDPYTYIKSNSADGQMDLGVDALLDYKASSKWVVTGVLGYTIQLQDTQAARVPDGTSAQMEWEIDENVDRDLGDVFIARVSSVYQILEKYWMTAGLELAEKREDKYTGTEFETWQYDLMAKNSAETRQLARVGFRYLGKSWRHSYQSRSQLSAGLEYLTVFAGKNTAKADAAAIELNFSY